MNPISLPQYRRITQFLISTTIIIAVSCTGFSPTVAGTVTATDKSAKPADAFFNSQRVIFDCTAIDTLDFSPGMVDTLRGDTTDGPTDLPNYNCAPWEEAGPEHIYRLDVASELEFWAGLRNVDDIDHDLFLLNACDTEQCLVGANIELSIILEPGTYYLIIDGAGSGTENSGPYTVAMESRWVGLPPAICEPGYAQPVSCGGDPSTFEGSLFQNSNHVQVYSCSSIIERGGEAWFAVTLEAHHEFTATTTALGVFLDAAIWLFDDCGNEAQCLAFADNGLAGANESLGWRNDSSDPLTVYLALDSYRAPDSEAAGNYSIDFSCQSNVPLAKTTWGSVRAAFR